MRNKIKSNFTLPAKGTKVLTWSGNLATIRAHHHGYPGFVGILWDKYDYPGMRKIFTEKVDNLIILDPEEYNKVKVYSEEELVQYYNSKKGINLESKKI